MKKEYHFLLIDFPAALKGLKENSLAEWGEMTAIQMLEHLRKGFELSLSKEKYIVKTPAEHLPKMKDFIQSDKALRPGAAKPYSYDTLADLELDFNEMKVELMRGMMKMLTHFENFPDHSSIHPSFGELNVQEWLRLHSKHLQHHLRQFTLIEA
ncbi:MAG: hypothetical protein DA405_07180 [Bacteroidetes bacterium]|nr:MAG: hypothetical protein DA405_07180 [Bacteroidota bacterium]